MVDVLDLIDAVQETRCQLVFLAASVEPMLQSYRVPPGIGEGLGLILARLADDLQAKVIGKHKPKDYLKQSERNETIPVI